VVVLFNLAQKNTIHELLTPRDRDPDQEQQLLLYQKESD